MSFLHLLKSKISFLERCENLELISPLLRYIQTPDPHAVSDPETVPKTVFREPSNQQNQLLQTPWFLDKKNDWFEGQTPIGSGFIKRIFCNAEETIFCVFLN